MNLYSVLLTQPGRAGCYIRSVMADNHLLALSMAMTDAGVAHAYTGTVVLMLKPVAVPGVLEVDRTWDYLYLTGDLLERRSDGRPVRVTLPKTEKI